MGALIRFKTKNLKMDRRDFLKKGISAAVGIMAYSTLSNLAEGKERSKYNPYMSKYTKIDWVLYRDDEKIIHGATPDAQEIKKLEELVCTDKSSKGTGSAEWKSLFAYKEPREIEPTDWDITALAKLVPVKRLIEQHAQYYSINPMWATMFLTFESLLKPADYNKMSNDFGLGQIKLKSEKLAKSLGTNPRGKLYSPYLKKEKIIFDPETNIIMAMLLHRYNIEAMNLKNSDQVYAVYVRGKAGLSTFTKKPNRITKEIIDSIHERYLYYENVVPLFRLEKDEVASIENPDTKFLLGLYHSGLETKEMYEKEMDYFLGNLEKKLAGDVRSVLVYDDCVTFERALETVWNHNPRGAHGKLLEIGSELSKLVGEDKDLKDRVEKTIEVLKEKEIDINPPKKKRWIFF